MRSFAALIGVAALVAGSGSARAAANTDEAGRVPATAARPTRAAADARAASQATTEATQVPSASQPSRPTAQATAGAEATGTADPSAGAQATAAGVPTVSPMPVKAEEAGGAPAAGASALPSEVAPAAPEPEPAVASPSLPGPSSVGNPALPKRPARSLPADTEVTIDRANRLGLSLGYGGPVGAAATLSLVHGLGADVRQEDTRVKAVCGLPIPHCAGGFLVEAGAGPRGGRFSLGFGGRVRVKDEDFHGSVGAAVKLSAARTWARHDEPDRTYVGPELDIAVQHVGLSFGLLWRVSGGGRAVPTVSWGVGFVL